MWFVFCPATGETMEVKYVDPDTNELKIHMVEFESAADGASWAARFLERLGSEGKMEELHLINLEQGVTIVLTYKKNDGVQS